MITWLWGCMVIFFKGCLGSILFSISLGLMGLIGGGVIGLIALIINSFKPKKKEEGELKSLVDEIDKDLK